MNTVCEHCRTAYDDAERSTLCPHGPIMPPADLARKKRALDLPRALCFALDPDGAVYHLQSIGWNGFVTVAELDGEYPPSLFVPAAAP